MRAEEANGASGERPEGDVREPAAGSGGLPGAASRDRLERAVEGLPLILFGTDREARYTWLANVQAPWSEDMLPGRTDVDLLGEEQGSAILDAKLRVLRTGEPERLEFDVRFDRQRHWYELTIRPDPGGGLVCSALDVSEKKRREIMLQALLREVSHRSRNLLAMVLSIAQQTSRKAFDKHTFLNRFTGRIQSIARSQDAITSSDWRGAALSELVDNQIVALLPGRAHLVVRDGPDLQFTPNAALHVGLALHELTTNALAFGALSHAEGRLRVSASLPGGASLAGGAAPEDGDGRQLALIEWHERDGPGADHPGRESFGMVTLKRIVPAAVGGRAEIEFLPDGLLYRLWLDASQYDPIPDTLGPSGGSTGGSIG